MGHKNYSKFSEYFKNKNNESNNEIIEEPTIIEEIFNSKIVENQNKEVEYIKGVVSVCEKLNMRKEANKESDVVTILSKNTEVKINLSESTDDFYKVTTSMGFEGFCMKKFIYVK